MNHPVARLAGVARLVDVARPVAAARLVVCSRLIATLVLSATAAACATGVQYTSGQEGDGSITIGPGVAQEEVAVSLDRTEVPTPSAVRSFDVPAPDIHVLQNGLRVWIVPGVDLPLSYVELIVPGGASVLGPGEAGLATMVADLLVEGAGLSGRELTGFEISDAADRLGAQLRTTATYDAVVASVEVLTGRLPDALDLLAAVALRPTFPPEEIERVRGLQVGRLLQNRDDAGSLADDALRAVLYAPSDPYGWPLLGDSGSVAAVDRGALVGFHERLFSPAGSALIVVSDLESEELLQLVRSRFADWSGSGRQATATEVRLPDPVRRTVHIVDKPGAPQSEIRVGQVGVARSSPDYYPVTVLNTLLGGAFTSRLNSVLREEKGFTYGAFSAFWMGRRAGPFEVTTAVHTPVTAEAVADVLAEVERLHQEIVSEDELKRARNYASLRLPQRFQTVVQRADLMETLFLAGLSSDYYDTYVESILAVTAADVRRVARQYLDPEVLQIVVAGDLATIEAPLRRLDVGETLVR